MRGARAGVKPGAQAQGSDAKGLAGPRERATDLTVRGFSEKRLIFE